MYCIKCGSQIPDDAVFCPKCGFKQDQSNTSPNQSTAQKKTDAKIIASSDVVELKCPGCGAPIKPQIGEMIITCEYCGASISLVNEGWKSIESNTMLPLKIQTEDEAISIIRGLMDKGLLRRHIEEKSTNEGIFLSIVPYWIVPTSARTKYNAVDTGEEIGKVAGTAVLAGLLGGAMGGRRRMGMEEGMMGGMLLGGTMMGGMGSRSGSTKEYTFDQNYNYPVVAVKGLNEYQPSDYTFDFRDRIIFDTSKIPKGTKILNGDIGEDTAKNQAKTNVDQIQSTKVNQQHHSIRNIATSIDTSEPELLHVPIWFAKFDSKGKKIALVIDGHSGNLINSIGLD